jgi:hypothetical protein
MPSWKKVITSGSAAAFSSLIVSSTITGSISGSLTGSLFGTASWADSASRATTASYALTAAVFPFTGNAVITGSLVITGSTTSTQGFTGSLFGTASWAEASRRVVIGVTDLPVTYSNSNRSYIYHIPVLREAIPGTYPYSLLASTSSLTYSASIDLLMITASWARESLTASYALTAPGISPQGNPNEIQYNIDGTNFGGVPRLTYDGTDLIGTGSFTGRFDGNLRLGLFRGTYTTIPAPASKGSEVLVYSQSISPGTFTDNDVIRVYYKIDQATSDNAIYRIYIADTPEFADVSGSLTNLIANITASTAIRYVGIKRDLSYDGVKLRFINSGSTSTTDDIATTLPISEFTADMANTEYWMFFSAIPNQVAHTSKALSYSIERV